MASLGKTLILFGLVMVALGIIFSAGLSIPWLGRLPGDIYIRRGNFTFYFPLATCVLLSILLMLIVALLRR